MLPTFEDQCCLPKKGKEKEKEKEKKTKKNKVVKFCLETRARSEGCMAKAFETRCPKP